MQSELNIYLTEMKNIQKNLIDFLDEEDNEQIEEKFENLIKIFNDIQIGEDQHRLKLFLHLLLQISDNHHRCNHFFDKIEKIIQIFQNEIKKYNSNIEIINIFKTNKRILLYLIESKIIVVDEYFVRKITSKKYKYAEYPTYFQPEIKPFMNESWFPKKSWVEKIKKELPENFYELRKIGENESFICKLIRNDSIKDFISYVNRNDISLDAEIEMSIYETNPYLIKNYINLIKYACFFGSSQIFNYLLLNKAKLNDFLWNFSIFSNNPKIINLLEDNHIEPKIGFCHITYDKCFKESIKCHHNDIAKYILNNYLQNNNNDANEKNIKHYLKYYNFEFIQINYISEESFGRLIKYDYYSFAESLLSRTNFDINKKLILITIF